MALRVLVLSWEYPPLVYGGLGRHVHGLARALAAAGHAVTVVAPAGGPSGRDDGVRVVRAAPEPLGVPLSDLLSFVLAGSHPLTRTALRLTDTFDVVHAHDWVVAPAAGTIADVLGLPLVATVHATEAGRHQGWLPDAFSRTVHRAEWWLTRRASRIVVCSAAMRSEVTRLFEPPAQVEVIPNGIDVPAWQVSPDQAAAARARYAETGPLLALAARLEYEKGAHDAVSAVALLRRRWPGIRLVLAGTGTYVDALRTQVHEAGLRQAVCFPGRLGQPALAALLAAADVAVVPSRYEPFGLAALEAAAAGTPRVVAASGGLAESVTDGVDGRVVPAADPPALAAAVADLLDDVEGARGLAEAAGRRLRAEHSWPALARRTASVLSDARAAGPRPDPGPAPTPPTTNLLTGAPR